jgi:prepilin-type N-terminal cleavage/methylation domain-containing protein
MQADKSKRDKSFHKHSKDGFTIMEIVVATTIFAVIFVSVLTLFNYIYEINREGEALRQASQGMRNLVEGIVKEIRNGQISYGYVDPNPQILSPDGNLASPCGGTPGGYNSLINPLNPVNNFPPGYTTPDNRLAILDADGNDDCFYYASSTTQQYVGNKIFSSSTGGSDLMLAENNLTPQVLNPPNFSISRLEFIVNPTLDPYNPTWGTSTQPFVTILIEAIVKLPTGEQSTVYYQTTVSTAKYDIPNPNN